MSTLSPSNNSQQPLIHHQQTTVNKQCQSSHKSPPNNNQCQPSHISLTNNSQQSMSVGKRVFTWDYSDSDRTEVRLLSFTWTGGLV